MNISVIGSGYVGLVTGACFAELGNKVICADNDSKKISSLKRGVIPIYEYGLGELISDNVKSGRLSFSASIKNAVANSEVIFIAVGTPSLDNGEADLTGIESVAHDIAINMKGYRLIVEKSTVPVETGAWVKKTIATYVKNKVDFDVASNPEFLREGSAIRDFMNPDRIVIGVESKRAQKLLSELYRPLNAPLVITDIKSAELIKHASNSFLATKISFINAVSRICELVKADVTDVAQGMGLDKRIGREFLDAGVGYGGSCFPKDLDAFITISKKIGYDFTLLKAVRDINQGQIDLLINKVRNALWIIKDKTIALLGLSFKPNTDDVRQSSSLKLIKILKGEGAKIKVYDPKAMGKAKKILKNEVVYCEDAYEACRHADCLLLVTEWPEFKEMDFKRVKRLLKRPFVIDGRNIFNPEAMKKLGFIYYGIGRNSQ